MLFIEPGQIILTMETVKLEMTSDGRFVPAEGVRLSDYNPKELMLVAMCDCAGRTVLAIMEKMKISPLEMEIEGSGRITTDTVHAETEFTSFEVTYNVTCRTLKEQEHISRAIELAHDKHCGVVAMMRHIAPVERRIMIHSVEAAKA